MTRVNTGYSLMAGIEVNSEKIRTALPGIEQEVHPAAVFYKAPVRRYDPKQGGHDIEITKQRHGRIAVIHIVGSNRGRRAALDSVLSMLGATEIDVAYAEERVNRALMRENYPR